LEVQIANEEENKVACSEVVDQKVEIGNEDMAEGN
jgi:hypothetical protein